MGPSHNEPPQQPDPGNGDEELTPEMDEKVSWLILHLKMAKQRVEIGNLPTLPREPGEEGDEKSG